MAISIERSSTGVDFHHSGEVEEQIISEIIAAFPQREELDTKIAALLDIFVDNLCDEPLRQIELLAELSLRDNIQGLTVLRQRNEQLRSLLNPSVFNIRKTPNTENYGQGPSYWLAVYGSDDEEIEDPDVLARIKQGYKINNVHDRQAPVQVQQDSALRKRFSEDFRAKFNTVGNYGRFSANYKSLAEAMVEQSLSLTHLQSYCPDIETSRDVLQFRINMGVLAREMGWQLVVSNECGEQSFSLQPMNEDMSQKDMLAISTPVATQLEGQFLNPEKRNIVVGVRSITASDRQVIQRSIITGGEVPRELRHRPITVEKKIVKEKPKKIQPVINKDEVLKTYRGESIAKKIVEALIDSSEGLTLDELLRVVGKEDTPGDRILVSVAVSQQKVKLSKFGLEINGGGRPKDGKARPYILSSKS